MKASKTQASRIGSRVRRLGALLAIFGLVAAGCGGEPAAEEAEPSAIGESDDGASDGDDGASDGDDGASDGDDGASDGDDGASDGDEWDEVVAAAREEGELVVYLGLGVSEAAESLLSEFESEFGIDVTLDIAHARDHREKILAEQRSGRVIASLSTMGLGTAEELQDQAALDVLDVPNAANVREEFEAWEELVTFYATAYGFLLNTDVIDDPPVSWADLTDSRFEGQLAVDDPRTTGGGSTWFISMLREDSLGEDYLRAIADNVDIVTEGPVEMVARGDYGLLVAGQARDITEYPSAPLEWVAPDEGAVVVPQSLALIKNAPHPNAARVFANFLLSDRVQELISENVVPSVRTVTAVNPYFVVEDTLPVLPAGLGREEYYRLAEDIFGVR